MRFLLRRAGFYLLTAWAAITLNFFIPRMLPGDPVQSLLNRYQGQLTSEATRSLYVLFGLDEQTSLWQQYLEYWGNIFTGDFGLSFTFFPTPVSEIVAQSLPWTLGLVGVSTVISFALGTLAGVIAGWRRGSWADTLLPVTNFFSAIPYFWIGLIAIAVFAEAWQLFPASGGWDTALVPSFSGEFIGSLITHSVLPGLTIVISSVAGWILSMRNMMVTVSSEDFVTVAHAKGLKERTVMFGYAARNAVLPNVSGFALSLGFIVSGTLLTEMVFSYPGIGYILFKAVDAKDYPLMQGVFLIITMSVLVANMLADLIYAFLDPRTRREG
ncbi:ABC transporter permease [Stackebrandtia nassauensis]|uniref:Binding-protein-dependent transport systems inner membrane component n=1 Tax=Stackebrandtia nassauensis (strain DSM 44728 / CIP 108903 / NRRL B-16338 / NBRC 102104 / LLR-40K-21) TaxID=446470 RepID=D3Q6C5_STANL|nr:ABC transporter permease [Stackebrandtia nassauensis]ADD42300.1 binding-protein-dependent transport systems inner membrane component [Stackebrandtia nassauensis DSM 44728]